MPASNSGRATARPADPFTSATQLLTMDELCALLQMSRSTIERLVRSERAFPQPRRFGKGRLIRFVEAEVLDYIAGLPAVEYSDHAFDPNATGVR